MACSYPTTASSVGDWLKAINLSKYQPQLEDAGVSVATLPELTDEALQAAGVGIVGHRRRMVQASQTLAAPTPMGELSEAMEVEPELLGDAREREQRPEPTTHARPGHLLSVQEAIAAKEQMRHNSTSSVYISSTISKPDTEEITFCVAVVIHDRMMQGEAQPAEVRQRFYYFSEDNNPLYASPLPLMDDEASSAKKTKREVPTEETIYHTIHSIHECAGFSSECLIVSLVYMERIISASSVPILVTTWRPILLAALITAQKVWDDRSLHNADFSVPAPAARHAYPLSDDGQVTLLTGRPRLQVFCPMFTLKEINHLEKKVRAPSPPTHTHPRPAARLPTN